MQRIPEVETAKALMNEATTWSVMKWLREKKRVRKTADLANDALDRMSLAVQEGWPAGVRAAYAALATPGNGKSAARESQQDSPPIDAEMSLIVKKVKEADEQAYRARMDAEKAFDDAEKQLSTSLAREGCKKAIHSWDLHEKAIHKAEAVSSSK